ncbi:Leucine Rich Repeat [Seminavis robusta]|uniref:Leucine Rich Repeat n=1 Tax=Seminavis robusta TaxID=568900 RepID=A0A9N8DL89_9STRA|nr:Leucine Rich Repeat [Seminavis robusta]|eukprot:Sro118_g057760.1 Leucine Rich Repeat (685) ;mRNA; r:66197-68961
MKIVRERADAARLELETAGDVELVQVAEKEIDNNNNNNYDSTAEDAQMPQQTILTRQPGYSCRQLQWIPGAYPVDGPFLANDRSNTGTSEEGLDNWVEEIADDEIIAHPIDDDQQIDLLPNAEPLPTDQRSRQYWRQKLLCSLSAEIIVALLVVSIIVLIFVLTSTQGNRNQLQNQNESIHIPANPVEVATEQTFLESLNLPHYTQEALANSRSPQSKAYQWLVNNINNQTFFTQPDLPKWRLAQRFALATFYCSTRGDYWVKHRGWLDWETNECSWEQIFWNLTFSPDLSCNEMGEIKALVFWNANNLEGTLPPEIFLLGNGLQTLQISGNAELSGTLPTEIGLLTNLTMMSFGLSGLSGSLPTELGCLQYLTSLRVTHSHISGPLPSELGNLLNLTDLTLINTALTGTFPMNLGELSELFVLFLEDWNIKGTLPVEIKKVTNLALLTLQNCSISGTFPRVLSELPNLAQLKLGSNHLNGRLPPHLLSELTKLQVLSIKDNLFSGSIPTEIGVLSSLKQLELQNTYLSGTIPTELHALDNLTSLVLKNTLLSGRIPDKLCSKLYKERFQCFVMNDGQHSPSWLSITCKRSSHVITSLSIVQSKGGVASAIMRSASIRQEKASGSTQKLTSVVQTAFMDPLGVEVVGSIGTHLTLMVPGFEWTGDRVFQEATRMLQWELGTQQI